MMLRSTIDGGSASAKTRPPNGASWTYLEREGKYEECRHLRGQYNTIMWTGIVDVGHMVRRELSADRWRDK